FFPGPAFKGAAIPALEDATPLLKEERHFGSETLIPDPHHPGVLQRPSAWPGLAAHNDPVNVLEVQVLHGSEEWFERQEANLRSRTPQIVDSKRVIGPLDAHSH